MTLPISINLGPPRNRSKDGIKCARCLRGEMLPREKDREPGETEIRQMWAWGKVGGKAGREVRRPRLWSSPRCSSGRVWRECFGSAQARSRQRRLSPASSHWFPASSASHSQTPTSASWDSLLSQLPARPLPQPSEKPIRSLFLSCIISKITHTKKNTSIKTRHIQHSTSSQFTYHLVCAPIWGASPWNGSALIALRHSVRGRQLIANMAREFRRQEMAHLHRCTPWKRISERPLLTATTVYI